MTVNGGCVIQFCEACASDGMHCETCHYSRKYGYVDESGGIIGCAGSCVTGFYADSNNKCLRCTSGCSSCTSGTTCETCESGYPYVIKDSSGLITQCLDQCPPQYTNKTDSYVCSM